MRKVSIASPLLRPWEASPRNSARAAFSIAVIVVGIGIKNIHHPQPARPLLAGDHNQKVRTEDWECRFPIVSSSESAYVLCNTCYHFTMSIKWISPFSVNDSPSRLRATRSSDDLTGEDEKKGKRIKIYRSSPLKYLRSCALPFLSNSIFNLGSLKHIDWR